MARLTPRWPKIAFVTLMLVGQEYNPKVTLSAHHKITNPIKFFPPSCLKAFKKGDCFQSNFEQPANGLAIKSQFYVKLRLDFTIGQSSVVEVFDRVAP